MKQHESLLVRRAAVLGAGVMGAQIAAHLTNVGIQTILFDLASDKGNQNAIVEQSLNALKKLKPNPLAVAGIEGLIQPANYNTDLELLRKCDLVIEAISERLDWKQSLYGKITPYLAEHAVFATNTSGLSIEALAKDLPSSLKKRFCGVHFFNPPRYMKLVEVIPHSQTDQTLLNHLETFLVEHLGKGVVLAKDTPNFIGNRVGVFSLLATIHHSQELRIPADIVDALTGPLIGRPKSATFRTMDVVGLDTLAHVVNTMRQGLPQDPWVEHFILPSWIQDLIQKGALGQKMQVGIYKKVGANIQVFDYHDQCYRHVNDHIDNNILAILKNPDPKMQFEQLRQSEHAQAKFLWRTFRDVFHYCAYHLETIAHTARDIDLAMRWGFGWQKGPFETWQAAGWQSILAAIEEEAKQNASGMMSRTPLPDWTKQNNFGGPYQSGKAFCVKTSAFEVRSNLPVYKRQYFPDQVLTESSDEGETIFETKAIRMWSMGDNIPIVSFKTRKNCIGLEVLEGLQEAIAKAEKDYDALVIWQRHDTDFSVGANLKEVASAASENRMDVIENMITMFQDTALKLRYASIPTVSAIRGLTLGGGCELSMHASAIVAAFESYVGLPEVGVGILPAGAGSKELANRASLRAMDGDVFKPLRQYFEQVAMGQVSVSAIDAKRMGYLRPQDLIVYHTDELLYAAKKQAAFLADTNYIAPIPVKFTVAGKAGIANFLNYLVNLREGEFISDHDYHIGSKVAYVLCGGHVEAGSLVDEHWMLNLEKEAVLELAKTTQSQERIKYMLEKGKPLRN